MIDSFFDRGIIRDKNERVRLTESEGEEVVISLSPVF